MSARSGHGAGKVILLGEHAVVYGHPALAAALDLGVTATAAPGSGRLRVPRWGIDADLRGDELPARAVRAIGEAVGVDVSAHDIDVDPTVPSRAGLGSSAAFSVAIARALGAGEELVAGAAGAAENVFHGRASGVDVALASRGGIGLYTRAKGLLPLPGIAPFALIIGLSGQPRDTAARVADVARQKESAPVATEALLGRLGERAQHGAIALGAADLDALGALMNGAHEDLVELSLSTPRLDQLCQLSRDAGALGAKLTGAGGGGAMIALPRPGGEEAVVAALEAAGGKPRVVRIGSGASL